MPQMQWQLVPCSWSCSGADVEEGSVLLKSLCPVPEAVAASSPTWVVGVAPGMFSEEVLQAREEMFSFSVLLLCLSCCSDPVSPTAGWCGSLWKLFVVQLWQDSFLQCAPQP